MLTLSTETVAGATSVYGTAAYGRAVAAAEGGTWVLVHDVDYEVQLPLILRRIPGTEHVDATTPYGYGGLGFSDRLNDRDAVELWIGVREALIERGVVSLFVRFPPFLPSQADRAAGLPGLNVRSVANTILVPTNRTDEMWSAMHKRSRTSVRAAEKVGCFAEVVRATTPMIQQAREMYELTMDRVGAAQGYLFPDEYYRELENLGERLMIVRVTGPDGSCVAASFVLVDDLYAHYHLSGSTGMVNGANNLMLWRLMQWASQRGLAGIHLGGGLRDGDSLFRFKASFGGNPREFALGTSVLRPHLYQELCSRRASELGMTSNALVKSDFFPRYRTVA